MSTEPKIGTHVRFKLDRGPNTGDHRPAVIVRAWPDNTANLMVLTDGVNDDVGNLLWATGRSEGEDPGQWSNYESDKEQTETQAHPAPDPPPIDVHLVETDPQPQPDHTPEPDAPANTAQRPEPDPQPDSQSKTETKPDPDPVPEPAPKPPQIGDPSFRTQP